MAKKPKDREPSTDPKLERMKKACQDLNKCLDLDPEIDTGEDAEISGLEEELQSLKEDGIKITPSDGLEEETWEVLYEYKVKERPKAPAAKSTKKKKEPKETPKEKEEEKKMATKKKKETKKAKASTTPKKKAPVAKKKKETPKKKATTPKKKSTIERDEFGLKVGGKMHLFVKMLKKKGGVTMDQVRKAEWNENEAAYPKTFAALKKAGLADRNEKGRMFLTGKKGTISV